MIREAILKLAKKEDISYDMAKEVMNEIMSDQASEVQKSAYLTALSMKGETIEEITASAEEMRNHCIRLLHEMDVLEIVGTAIVKIIAQYGEEAAPYVYEYVKAMKDAL